MLLTNTEFKSNEVSLIKINTKGKRLGEIVEYIFVNIGWIFYG